MKRILFQYVLPTAVTVGLLALAFSLIEDPSEIPRSIARVPWWVHVLFVLVTAVSMYCRAIRWRALLPDHPLTTNQCFGPLMIGFMMNAVLPARAGEFGRSVVLGRQHRIPFSSVLGSVLLERIFDGVVLLASFAVVLNLLGASLPEEVAFGEWTVTADQMQLAVRSSTVGVAVVLLGIIGLLIPPIRRLAEAVIRALLPERLGHAVLDQFDKLIRGFRSLHSPTAVVVILIWTLVIWATVALSCQIGGWGFPELADISFLQAWAVTVFVCIAILLPASPGYWGLYEIGVIAACKALGLTEEAAIAFSYSIVIHFWQMAVTIVAGLYFMWAEGLKLSQLRQAEEAAPE